MKNDKSCWEREMKKAVCGLLCVMFAAASVCAKDVSLRLPVNAVVVSEDVTGTTWRQNAILRVTYTAAVNQLKAVIGQQGWRLKQELTLGTVASDRSLLVFARGETDITVMVWKISVGETGFSWGANENKKK